jgi:hypothetical protein
MGCATSDESGATQVYVRRFSAWVPRWRLDGKELFFLVRDGSMMAVDCNITDDAISFGQPRIWFGGNSRLPAPVLGRYTHSVAADRQRFLTLGSTAAPRMGSVDLLVNWQGLLRN